ncbi:MAG TPA: ABC transporter substrate-binding protein [Gammaproteobacteria bacterium]
MGGQRIRQYLAPAALLLAFLFAPQAPAEPSAAESRGKQIYVEGSSPSGGEITAIVGTEGVSLPASAVPCASCHGADGLGRREGGVIPPDIRWSELTKVYGHVHEDGRKHQAFDEISIARLIRTGLDPDFNQLDRSMPLYNMSVEDMNSLIAYLRFLEQDLDPGIGKDSIQFGTLLPLRGPRGELGQAMAQVMLAYFKDINQRGGVFGRRLELLAIPWGDSAESTLDNLRSAFEQEGVFALVGAYTIGMDDQLLELVREQRMPMIGPFTLNPGDAFVNQDVFYIYPGFAEQAQALAEQAIAQMKGARTNLVLVGPQGADVDGLIAAVEDRFPQDKTFESRSLRYPRGQLDASALATDLQSNGGDAILFLGGQDELVTLLEALDSRQHYPGIFALSAFAPQLYEAPAAFNQRIYLAYPTLSRDVSAAGRSEYQRLAETYALPPGHLQGQVAALAAVKLLVEGLRGAGHSLDRARLVEAIEALYRYDTGFTPPLTYGPNRRIGALGAHVMVVDIDNRTTRPVGEWRELR